MQNLQSNNCYNKPSTSKILPRNRRANDGSLKEQMKVYCRIKPVLSEGSCIEVLDNTKIQISRTLTSKTIHTFSRVFDEDSNQQEVFKVVCEPFLSSLLGSQNGLLFVYGVTGSGKTHTMSGKPHSRDPGIVPRILQALFNSLQGHQAPRHLVKPDKLNGFVVLTADEARAANQAEEKTIRFQQKPGNRNFYRYNAETLERFEVNKKSSYSVFITYVEVYNNYVFDLLDNDTDLRYAQKKIIRKDSQKNMYIHGVTEVEVSNARDACEEFRKGCLRRRTAFTTLNNGSSRSHSVFNIRVVKIPLNITRTSRNISVSQLSLVDLAGTERSNRTQNSGQRHNEAVNINQSLLTLRTCIELLRENQNGCSRILPYRESRLTHLFQKYFEGDGLMAMIVCINPDPDEYLETVQALKFAELSQEVKMDCVSSTQFIRNISEEQASTSSSSTSALLQMMSNFNPELLRLKGPDDSETLPNLINFLKSGLTNVNKAIHEKSELIERPKNPSKLTRRKRRSRSVGSMRPPLRTPTLRNNSPEHIVRRNIMGINNEE